MSAFGGSDLEHLWGKSPVCQAFWDEAGAGAGEGESCIWGRGIEVELPPEH